MKRSDLVTVGLGEYRYQSGDHECDFEKATQLTVSFAGINTELQKSDKMEVDKVL